MGKLRELAKTLLVLKDEYDYWVINEVCSFELSDTEKLLQEIFEKLWTELIESCVYLNHDVLYIHLSDKQRGRFIKTIKPEELKFSFFNKDTILCEFKGDRISEIMIHLNKL